MYDIASIKQLYCLKIISYDVLCNLTTGRTKLCLLNLIIDSSQKIETDVEIQNFGQELVKKKSEGGCGLVVSFVAKILSLLMLLRGFFSIFFRYFSKLSLIFTGCTF